MKLALILPCSIWFAPYVRIYEKVLIEQNVDYDLISWNRDGSDPKCGIQFMRDVTAKRNRLWILISYIQYVNFVKKIVRKHKYDKLIVFSSQLGIFLSSFLVKNYSDRYIFDYRDLSIEQKAIFKYPYKRLLRHSAAIFVSSPGFIKCLPQGSNYRISHNFDIEAVRDALDKKDVIPFQAGQINVLTIGGIRDYSSNIEVVKSLANKKGYCMRFVGKGEAATLIENYARLNGIKNIQFDGYYEKKDEHYFIKKASLLNIFYPKIVSHSTALSNRFYNALVYKKPMIVTAKSTQGDYVEKYDLGLSLEDCSELSEKIQRFFKNTDEEAFNQRCNNLLRELIRDYDEFYKVVKNFIDIEK